MKILIPLFLLGAGGIPIEQAEQVFDPEYQAIIDEYDRLKESFKMSHRDLQWHAVAKVMRGMIDVEDRLALIRKVRETPLWQKLPPTIAITQRDLLYYNRAKMTFMDLLKRQRRIK